MADKCFTYALKQPCRHRDPGLVSVDVRYSVIYDREKTGMHRVQCTRTHASIVESLPVKLSTSSTPFVPSLFVNDTTYIIS